MEYKTLRLHILNHYKQKPLRVVIFDNSYN